MHNRPVHNARNAAIKIIRCAWNLPPGMRPGDESLSEPGWYNSSPMDVYESADIEELDRAMRDAIRESAYADLSDDQVEELASDDYYSPVSVDLNWDSVRLEFQLVKPTISDAPDIFSVIVRNPFVD